MKPYRFNASRSFLISGEINYDTIGEVMPAVSKLDERVHPEGIHLYITSPGGLGTAGLALYDFLKTRKNKLTVIGSGECSSVAVLILQAGDRRLLTPHTRMLLHFGMTDMSAKGMLPADMLKKASEEMKRLDETVLDILCERAATSHPNGPRAMLRVMLREETYLTAQKAVHFGLADGLTYRLKE